MFERELAKLEKDIGGIQDMNALPDAMFVIDVGYHKIAVAEAKKLGIPVIGVVDTNHSPEGIDYVIPGNDDSAKAVALYARAVADAVLEGKAKAVHRGRAVRRRQRRVRRGQRRGIAPSFTATSSAHTLPEPPPGGGSSMITSGRGRACLGCSGHDGPHVGVDMPAITASMVGRTARQDRRADDGVQEGADRGRWRHDARRRDPARQARQQGRQGRVAHHRRGRGGRGGRGHAPARWSRSTARPTSCRRTIRSWRSPRRVAQLVADQEPAPTWRRCRRCRCRRTASARRWKTCARA